MSDEKIEVEWIATANKMVQVLDSLNNKFDKQEKQLQKLADTSKKSADGAANSFNKLEQELKDNEAAMKKLAIGSKEFDEQRQKVDQLRASFRKTKEELAELKPDTSSWTKTATVIGATTAAAWALVSALKSVSDAHDTVISKGAETIVQLDTMARKMQIQAGLTDPQRQAMSEQIIRQSSDAGVTAEAGFQAATQLAGSGFDNAVESGTLKTVLDTIQAGSFTGQPDQLVAAFSQVMNASGIEKTNENLQRIAVAAQSLFKKTDFQLTDLSEFAAIGATVKGANVEITEGIAAFTALRDSLPAGESATGLRNLITKFQKGDVTKEGKEDLKRIGVTADQVDFVGEDLRTVLTTVKAAVEKMPEADRNAALGKLFGTENVTTARMLINSAPRIQELMDAQGNMAQFQADRATAAESMQAARNRQANKELVDQIPISSELNKIDIERLRREGEYKQLSEVAAVRGGGIGTALAEGIDIGPIPIPGALSVGKSVDTLIPGAPMESTSRGMLEVFKSLFRSSAEQQAETNKLLAEQNAMLKQQQQPQRNPDQPAARPKEAPLPAATVP